MTTTGPAERPLRADAARNLDRVLGAAREVFAEQGVDAQIDDVARRAGVGVGTVYRRFPNKEALLEAVLDRRLGELDVRAQEALTGARSGAEALAAFTALVTALVDAAAADRVLIAALRRGPGRPGHRPGPGHGLHDALGALLDRARDGGAVHADVEVATVRPLVAGLMFAAVHAELDADPAGALRILLRGIAAG